MNISIPAPPPPPPPGDVIEAASEVIDAVVSATDSGPGSGSSSGPPGFPAASSGSPMVLPGWTIGTIIPTPTPFIPAPVPNIFIAAASQAAARAAGANQHEGAAGVPANDLSAAAESVAGRPHLRDRVPDRRRDAQALALAVHGIAIMLGDEVRSGVGIARPLVTYVAVVLGAPGGATSDLHGPVWAAISAMLDHFLAVARHPATRSELQAVRAALRAELVPGQVDAERMLRSSGPSAEQLARERLIAALRPRLKRRRHA